MDSMGVSQGVERNQVKQLTQIKLDSQWSCVHELTLPVAAKCFHCKLDAFEQETQQASQS